MLIVFILKWYISTWKTFLIPSFTICFLMNFMQMVSCLVPIRDSQLSVSQHCQTHPNFSTGNSQGIVWVCIYDLSRCVCVCVYVYACMYTCLYVYVYVCVMYMCVCVCVWIYLCMYIYVRMYMYIYMDVYMYLCGYIFICVYICMYTYVNICMLTC